jgi:hypothetical protein
VSCLPLSVCSSTLTLRLELYFSDKRNFLIVFKDKKQRQGIVSKLGYKSDQAGSISKSIIGNFLMDQVARAIDRSEQQLDAMTRRWQHREISNVSLVPVVQCYRLTFSSHTSCCSTSTQTGHPMVGHVFPDRADH